MAASDCVEEAIRVAQEAVVADERCDFAEAIALYSKSTELIKRGLQIQKEDESVDNTVLHRYCKLYTERIAVLESHAQSSGGAKWNAPGTSAVIAAPGSSGLTFTFDDAEIVQARLPPPEPTQEWRRPYWLMAILRVSMSHGGFLSPDGRVYVPRRMWLQKGAKFGALGAKLDCAETLVNRLRTVCATDRTQPKQVAKDLGGLCDLMDTLQNSLARALPFVSEVAEKKGGVATKLKGLSLLKSLDKTAARLGAIPAKCADPSEYIQTLVDLFDSAAFVEGWIEHFSASPLEHASIWQQLHRVNRFFYEVLCAFVVQDLNKLLERYTRKTSAAFLKGADAGAASGC